MKNKKLLTIILLFVTIGLLGAAVYIGYYLSKQTTTPSDVDAGGGAGACCYAAAGCTTGWKCDTSEPCDECEPPSSGYGGVPCGATGQKCRRNFACTGSGANKCCPVFSLGTCVRDDTAPGQCDNICEWPEVVVSGRCNANVPVCHCARCNGIYGCSDPTKNFTGCSGNPPKCTPGGCPTGTTECGDSTNHESGGGCERYDIKCQVNHADCNNPSYIYRYCKPQVVITTVVPTTPVVTTPVITTPVITTPVITTPVITTPVITTPVITTPVITTPVITTPVVTTPVVTTPVVTTPNITQPVVTTPNIPRTAIISDKYDMIIFGSILFASGVVIFALGYNEKIGIYFYKFVGRKNHTDKEIFEENINKSVKNHKSAKKKNK